MGCPYHLQLIKIYEPRRSYEFRKVFAFPNTLFSALCILYLEVVNHLNLKLFYCTFNSNGRWFALPIGRTKKFSIQWKPIKISIWKTNNVELVIFPCRSGKFCILNQFVIFDVGRIKLTHERPGKPVTHIIPATSTQFAYHVIRCLVKMSSSAGPLFCWIFYTTISNHPKTEISKLNNKTIVVSYVGSNNELMRA